MYLKIYSEKNIFLQQGIQIIAVGIGSFREEALREFCSEVYMINSYDELANSLPVQFVEESKITFTFSQVISPISFTDPLELDITVKNLSKTPIPNSTRLFITSDGYYHEKIINLHQEIQNNNIPVNQSVKIRARLEPTGSAINEYLRFGTISRLPSMIQVSLRDLSSGLQYFSDQCGFELEIRKINYFYLSFSITLNEYVTNIISL
jgi:hypothetical protein